MGVVTTTYLKETILDRRGGVILWTAAAAPLAVAMAWWPSSSHYGRIAEASREMLAAIAAMQLLTVCSLTPPLTAASVSSARLRNTLEELLTAPLGVLGIAMGRLAAALLTLILVTACILPSFGVVLMLGGADAAVMGRIIAISLCAAVCIGVFSMAAGTLTKTMYGALQASYLFVLALTGGTVLPYLVLEEWKEAREALSRLAAASPIVSMMEATGHGGLVPGGGGSAWWISPLVCLSLAVPSAALFLVGMFLMSKNPMRPSREKKRRLPFFLYLVDPARRRRPILWAFNCMLAKERRTRLLGNVSWLIRSVYACFVLSLAAAAASVSRLGAATMDYLLLVMCGFQLGFLALAIPSLGAPAVAGEVEGGTIELLRTTRLGATRMLYGKVMYSLAPTAVILVAFTPIWYVLYQVAGGGMEMLPILAITLGWTVFCTAVGMAASSLCATSARASMLAYIAVGVYLAIGPAAVATQAELPERLHLYAVSSNPVLAAAQSLSSSFLRDYPPLWTKCAGMLAATAALFMFAAWVRTRNLLEGEK